MPNSPEPLTEDVARRWTQARMPTWAPWLLVAVAVVGVGLSIATDHTVCSPRDPAACGPDLAFAWAAAFLITGLVTLWVWPVAASFLVLGYVGLDLVYDPARPARVAFAVLGLLVLAYAVWHVALRAHQRSMLAALAGPAHPPVLSGRTWPRPGGLLVGAAIAVVVSGMSGLWYAHQVAETADHVASSVVLDSVAGRVDSDGEQTFTLSSPPAGTPATVSILPALDAYEEGSHQPVRVDLQDREWVRLVAEPDDHTHWLSLSLGTGILALLMLSYANSRALNRRRLGDVVGWSGVGVSVRVIANEVWVSAADGSHSTLATFVTSHVQDELRARDGVLVGDLRAQGWAAVWTEDSVLLPLSRLSVQGDPQVLTDAAAEDLLRSSEEEDWEGEWDDLDPHTPWRKPAHSSEAHGGPSLAGRVKARVLGRDGARRIDDLNRRGRDLSESGPVTMLLQIGAVGLGAFMIWFSASEVGPTWRAAHEQGVPGAVTVTEIDCGGKGGCNHYGTFRSDDGDYEFTDVSFVNGEAEVGQQARALYEGEGENPDSVYGPGWGGFVENGFYLGVGVTFLAGFGLGGVLERIMLRRRPGGRHARPV